MAYGIANKSGKPNSDLAKQIVKGAWESGIREYDTAQGYGESEKVLGNALHSLGFSSDARVITKLDPNLEHLDKDALEQAVRGSLSRLGVPILHGLMLHRETHLNLWEKGLGDFLQKLVKEGLTDHIGASFYSPEKAKLALETDGIDMIQIPSSILDRRFEKAGVFELAENKGKQIYVRSVFLQGLLIMDSESVPPNMQFAVEVLKKLEDFSQETGFSKQELALAYVRIAYPQTKVVLGVDTPEQISGNLKSWETTLPVGFVERVQEEFGYVEERILNPALWPN
jgi:aryl-alcohol dehydrogenase-like predicted oxidoreductase